MATKPMWVVWRLYHEGAPPNAVGIAAAEHVRRMRPYRCPVVAPAAQERHGGEAELKDHMRVIRCPCGTPSNWYRPESYATPPWRRLGRLPGERGPWLVEPWPDSERIVVEAAESPSAAGTVAVRRRGSQSV